MDEDKPDKCEFAAAVKRVITSRRYGSVSEIAQRAGISRHVLNGRLYGRVFIRPDEARRLIHALGDQSLAEWHLRGTKFTIAAKPTANAERRELVELVASLIREAADVWQEVLTVTDYSRLSPKEKADFEQEVRQVEFAIANLRKYLDDAKRPDR